MTKKVTSYYEVPNLDLTNMYIEDVQEFHHYKNYIKQVFPIPEYFHVFLAGGGTKEWLLDSLNHFPVSYVSDLQIKQKKILIDFCKEGYLEFADIIYEHFVEKHKIPPEQIVFICSSVDYVPYVQNIAKLKNTQSLELYYYAYFERIAKNVYMADLPEDLPNPLLIKNFTKKYINLNRRWKAHRLSFLSLLHSRNLIDVGYNSFPLISECVDQAPAYRKKYIKGFFVDTKNTKINTDMTDDELYDILFNEALMTYSSISDEIQKGYDVKNRLPLIVDSNDFAENQNKHMAYSSQRKLLKFARSSYFTIVTETHYNNASPRFITEKTFKPVFYKHPFVILSPPNTLERFRYQGYKSFSPYIDESYDLETDDSKRLLMILKEVERLSNLSQSELDEFCAGLAPIVEHNYKVLREKTEYLEKL